MFAITRYAHCKVSCLLRQLLETISRTHPIHSSCSSEHQAMASTARFTGPEVSISNLATLPTWMALRTVQRVQNTVTRTAARFEPRFITRAVSKSQVSKSRFYCKWHSRASSGSLYASTSIPCYVEPARCFLQAGYQNVTLVEGVLAFSHAAIATVNSLSENLLQYSQDRCTPALVVSAVQQVSSKSQTSYLSEHKCTSIVQCLQDIRITALEKEVVTGQL